MRLTAFFLAALMALPADAMAQAAAKGCFTPAEITAEQIVRVGLRLREGARACGEKPWNAGTQGLWDQLDQRFGRQFAAQTAVRQKAFQREFSDDADNRLEMWNGRIVMYYRHYPVSEVYCGEIKSQMEKVMKSGWSAVTKAAKASGDAVRMDYRPCS
ncbi:MAG: hypothetical protein F8N37_07705 [Telmatospirillum sp.]|nr:hypothetical protein [Telmatospirillum sp.]